MIFAKKNMDINLDNKSQIILMFLVLTIFGAFSFGVLGSLSALLFLDINTFSSNFNVDLLSNQQQINLFRLTQPFSTIGIFLFSPLTIMLFFRNKLQFNFSNYKISYSSILSASVLIIIVKPIVSFLAGINNSIDFSLLGNFGKNLIETSNHMSEKIAMVAVSNSWQELILNMLIIALIPAIAEEFFFRGFLQQYLSKYTRNYHISVWITAIIFGIIHFNIINILPLVFLGAILGYIYHFSQNIWVSILAHFINNASLLWFIYEYSYNVKDTGNETSSIQSVIFSLVMTLALLFFMYTAWEHKASANADK